MEQKINELLNTQINHEFYSAYLYFAMSTYFSEINMDGFAKYMKNQAKEELSHAQKIYDHLILRNEKITYKKIEAPDTDWVNPQDVLDNALKHEEFITSQIFEIAKAAKEANDFATKNFINWFVEEQLEEEDKFRKLKEKIKAFDECSCTIEAINRELDKDGE